MLPQITTLSRTYTAGSAKVPGKENINFNILRRNLHNFSIKRLLEKKHQFIHQDWHNVCLPQVDRCFRVNAIIAMEIGRQEAIHCLPCLFHIICPLIICILRKKYSYMHCFLHHRHDPPSPPPPPHLNGYVGFLALVCYSAEGRPRSQFCLEQITFHSAVIN